MLRGVVQTLAARGAVVSVVARRAHRLDRLASDVATAGGKVEPVALDYRDGDMLSATLARVQSMHGPFALAVCWIRSDARGALMAVANELAIAAGDGPPTRLLHVLGSAAADPTTLAEADHGDLPEASVRYQRAILGFVVEDGRSRWLTDDEIADGVVAALDSDDDPFIVGTVRPWSARP